MCSALIINNILPKASKIHALVWRNLIKSRRAELSQKLRTRTLCHLRCASWGYGLGASNIVPNRGHVRLHCIYSICCICSGCSSYSHVIYFEWRIELRMGILMNYHFMILHNMKITHVCNFTIVCQHIVAKAEENRNVPTKETFRSIEMTFGFNWHDYPPSHIELNLLVCVNFLWNNFCFHSGTHTN